MRQRCEFLDSEYMPCREYDLLDRARSIAIEALEIALRSRANSIVKSRARSRLMITDTTINSHVSACRECQREGREPAESYLDGLLR
jgi:hypothetical protein